MRISDWSSAVCSSDLLEEVDDGALGQPLEVIRGRRAPPGGDVDLELATEMIDETAGGIFHGHRMDRPGNRPGEPSRTRFFAERAEGIVAPGDADVRLDPASIEPLFELRPFVSRERSALEAHDARRRRVGAKVAREIGGVAP